MRSFERTMRLRVMMPTGVAMPLAVRRDDTIQDVKKMIKRMRQDVPDEIDLELYVDDDFTLAYKNEVVPGQRATLEDYQVLDMATMYIAPYNMSQVPVIACNSVDGPLHEVFPPDAMGYTTNDGAIIVGFDMDQARFLLHGMPSKSVNAVVFEGPLIAPTSPVTHSDVLQYGNSCVGNCKILSHKRKHIIVRNAEGRTVALLPSTVRPLMQLVLLTDVRVVYNRNDALVFPFLRVTGGLMDLVDQVLHVLHAVHGLKAVGKQRVRRIGGLSLLHKITELAGTKGIMLSLQTQFKRVKPMPDEHVPLAISCSRTSAIVHNFLLDKLDTSPWLLPRSPAELMSLVHCTSSVKFDANQLREPYVFKDNMISLSTQLPAKTVDIETFDPDTFVHLVRTGKIIACKNGYATQLQDGSWALARCTVNLHEKHRELERLHDELLPIDVYQIDHLIKDCPMSWLRTTFGDRYDEVSNQVKF